MLLLIISDRNIVRLIKQNVCCHQRRIGEKTGIDIIGILGALVLELRHAGKFSEHRIAIQNPSELCVRRNMALHKQRVFLRIKTAGNILCELFQRSSAQICGILANGDRVKIRHKIVAVKFFGTCAPVFDRTEVGAERQIAGGLNAGKHYFFRFVFFHEDSLLCLMRRHNFTTF